MINIRPVVYVIGVLTFVLGLTMLIPMGFDMITGDPEWRTFLESAFLTSMCGAILAITTSTGKATGIDVRLSFLLTVGVWIVMPAFAALPFIVGREHMPFVDAYFESVSGLTTTGTTIIPDLDVHSFGLHLWRAILQWLGGLGIVIFAMVFLPAMRVGGMQFFRSEGFDTAGKALPRAIDISKSLFVMYVVLTILCFFAYVMSGIPGRDAFAHALTTISTGGYSTHNASFDFFGPLPHYVAVVFMILAGLPFVRFIQFAAGDPKPLLVDPQIRAYLIWTVYAVALVVIFRIGAEGRFDEELFHTSLFNVVSIFSGTGYGTGDLTAWGAFPLSVLFAVGAIGSCTGSTGCSIKVFRYQILFRSIVVQIQRLYSPHHVVNLRFDGKTVSPKVSNSIMFLFTAFMIAFGILVIFLGMTGLSFMAALTGAWTAIFNIGPVFGAEVGAAGDVVGFPERAKWFMILGMIVGRLEIVAVLVLLLPRFWRF